MDAWLTKASNRIDVLPVGRPVPDGDILGRRRPEGAAPLKAVLRTGGLIIDGGWLRILGGSGSRMTGSLATWNGLAGEAPPAPPPDGAFIVGHDAVGGFFALNDGAFEGPDDAVFYLAPDTLVWENLGMDFAGFLRWAARGDLGRFYEAVRWPGWEADAARLAADEGFSIYPFLVASGPPIGERARSIVPMTELWTLHNELAAKLRALPEGAPLTVRAE